MPRLLIVSRSAEQPAAIVEGLRSGTEDTPVAHAATIGEARQMAETQVYDAILIEYDADQHVVMSREDADFLRATVSRVNHEIKNPLSIISGNAQLLGELARALGLQEDLMQPIRDIEEASQRVAALLNKLQDVSAMLPPGKRG